MRLSVFSYIVNLIIESVQIARRGGLLIERIKSLRTLEKLAIRTIIRFLQLKPVLRYHISLIILDVTQGEAGYNRVQRGLPPRAVANPNDPSYSHFPEVCVLLNTLYS